MTTYNTGNPIGSTDARDRLDNSENMDILENSTTLNAHHDRLGVLRKTRKGMELEHDNQISAHETEHDNQISAHEAEHDNQISAHEIEHDAQITAHEVEHDNQMQFFENDFDSRLAGMAFTRVGTFTAGATLTDMRQTLLWEVSQGGDGHEYGWTGSFPKVVAAGATPATSGGIGAGAWVDRTQETLRSELLSQGGASLIGTTTGDTVEQLLSYHDITLADKADLAGSSTQTFSVADATTDTQAASYGQVKLRTSSLYVTASITGGGMTLTLPRQTLWFRDPSFTTGNVVEHTLSSDLTLNIPNGATLGSKSGIMSNLIPIVLYNKGSPVLGVVNLAGGVDLSEVVNINSTAISTSSSSAEVVYSSVSVSASPYRCCGVIQLTQSIAGTWASPPTVVANARSILISSLASIGFGQSAQNMIGSRALGTTYYNTTGRPLFVTVSLVNPSNSTPSLYLGGVLMGMIGGNNNSLAVQIPVSFIVPHGVSYKIVANGSTLQSWMEVR